MKTISELFDQVVKSYTKNFTYNSSMPWERLVSEILILKKYDSKKCALTGLYNEDGDLVVGIAEQDERGYTDTGIAFLPNTKYNDAMDVIVELNEKLLDLTRKDAAIIVLSSMRK